MKRSIIVLLLLTLPCILPATVSASSLHQVLGDSTTTTFSMPPTIEGPGFLLPDNPLYFLDNIKQQIRLFFAFTPDKRAEVYTAIAGERLAEMRFELQKGNLDAAEVALQGVKDNTKAAAKVISDAKFQGMDMSTPAESVNETIKRRLASLDVLDAQATGEMKAEVDAADVVLSDAKMEVEDALPQPLLQNEIQYDINRDIAKNLLTTKDSASELEAELAFLQMEASQTAQLSLKNRQAALKQSMSDEQKNLQGEKLSEEQKNQDAALQLNGPFEQEVQTIVSNAEKASSTLQTSK